MSKNNVKRPIILKRMIMKPQGTAGKNTPGNPDLRHFSNKVVKLATIPLYREDIIFGSNGETYLPGEYRSITIINKLNNLNNNCQTIAKCVTHDGVIVEKTSEKLTQLIGQEAFNTLFYALCSVINQEYRIKAMLSLLTVNESIAEDKKPDLGCLKIECMGTNEKYCQTDETRIDFKKKRAQRRMRKILVPYVVKTDEVKIKKVTVDPLLRCVIKSESTEVSNPFKRVYHRKDIPDLNYIPVKRKSSEEPEPLNTTLESTEQILPDLGYHNLNLDDNSNDSDKTFSTLPSFKTTTELLINPTSLVNNVDKHTKEDQIVLPNHEIRMMDGTVIKVPFKPEDQFHVASKENLQFLDEPNRKKLLLHQMQVDYRHCLSLRDEDGNLPIHLAVINEDLELLKRQCVVLKIRNQSVDIPANNGLTALKLSLFWDSAPSTNTLLQQGADPFLADEDHSTCAHIAAELKSDQLSLVLNHCKLHARKIIIQHGEELQTPGWESKSDKDLGNIVLNHICSLFDKQGYTPLMLASKLGHYENVRLLIENAPNSVHHTMPTCGNTALFLAVAAASCLAAESGNKAKIVDHFRKTIEILLDAGADPSTDNHGGSNVNLLLQEFNCAELSMLIANKVTSIKFFNGEGDHTKNFDKFILMKDGENVSIQEMHSKRNSNKTAKKNDKKEHNNVTKIDDSKGIDSNVTKSIDNHETNPNDSEKHVTQNVFTHVPKGVGKHVTNSKDLEKHVTKQVDKHVTTDASKPVITENILIKTPLKVSATTNSEVVVQNKVNSKDFVIKPINKIDTVQSVKKIIWYPLKRKVDAPKTDQKRPKITK